jgi:hypothetical protein
VHLVLEKRHGKTISLAEAIISSDTYCCYIDKLISSFRISQGSTSAGRLSTQDPFTRNGSLKYVDVLNFAFPLALTVPGMLLSTLGIQCWKAYKMCRFSTMYSIRTTTNVQSQ